MTVTMSIKPYKFVKRVAYNISNCLVALEFFSYKFPGFVFGAYVLNLACAAENCPVEG